MLDFETKLPQLDQLYQKLFDGGKGLRAQLVKDVSVCLHRSNEDSLFLSQMVENIHHGSLLHDDVIDKSKFRRNKKTAWVQFSKKKAILAGDYLLSHTSLMLSELGNLDLLKLTSHTVKNMVKGEWLQQEIVGKENFKDLDTVNIYKTGSLFEWCLKAPFLLISPVDFHLQKKLSKIAMIFGHLFQRADDVLDFGIRGIENKHEFKDLQEGYTNYFGYYLKEKLKIKTSQALKNCRNFKELEQLIGEKDLKIIVESFDKMNETLLQVCIEEIDQLKDSLEENQMKLISVLKFWGKKLYVRDE